MDSFIHLALVPINNCSIFVVPDSPPNDGHLPAPAPKEEEEEESEDDPDFDFNHDPDAPMEWGPW